MGKKIVKFIIDEMKKKKLHFDPFGGLSPIVLYYSTSGIVSPFLHFKCMCQTYIPLDLVMTDQVPKKNISW